MQQLVQKGKLEHIEKDNAANNRMESLVPLTALTEKQQIKWEHRKRSELGLEPVPLPCKSAPKPDPRQMTLQDLTGDQRDNVGFWCDILQEWQRVRANRGYNLGKCKVDELYCATVKLKYPNISISPDILYRKYKAYKVGDLAGLVDHRGGHNKGKSSIPQYMLDAFYSLYLHDNTTLPAEYVESLKKEYTGVYYDRFIRGNWVVANGAIYKVFSDTPTAYNAAVLPHFDYINIGLDFGGNGSRHALVASGITHGCEK